MMSPPPPIPLAPTSPVPIGQGPVASTPVPSPAAQAPAPGPSTIAPDSCMLTQNTDLFGGDLPNASFPSTSPQDCCTACLANPSCFAWTLSSVQNKCYLKAKTGWQLHANVTCCMSGTANRNGVIVSLPYPSPSPSMASSPGGGVTQSPNNPNVGNTGIPSPPTANAIGPSSSLGRRKLLELPFSQYSRRSMLQASSTSSGIRYIVTSTAPTADLLSLSTTVVQYNDAGEKAKFVIDMAVPDKLSQVYYRLESIGFWFGCVFLAACALNFGAWMFLKCCESEMPGVLYVPRMQLILLMLLMSALAYVGAILLVNNLGLIPLVVGITVVVCGPLLFLTASAFGIAAALYGKRKAVYLLSSRSSRQDSTQHSRWELVFVAQIMGMSLNRGKWRPPESSRKNEFVFRFGPIFEDCRGKT